MPHTLALHQSAVMFLFGLKNRKYHVTPYYCRLGDLLCFVFIVWLLYVWFVCVLYVPSVLWYCWLGLLTCKNRLPYNLYCVGGHVKHCTIQSNRKIFISDADTLSAVRDCSSVSVPDVANWAQTVHCFFSQIFSHCAAVAPSRDIF